MKHPGRCGVLFGVLAAILAACSLDERPDPVGPPHVPDFMARERQSVEAPLQDAGSLLPPLAAAPPAAAAMPVLFDAALPPPLADSAAASLDDAGASAAPHIPSPPTPIDCATSPCAPPTGCQSD